MKGKLAAKFGHLNEEKEEVEATNKHSPRAYESQPFIIIIIIIIIIRQFVLKKDSSLFFVGGGSNREGRETRCQESAQGEAARRAGIDIDIIDSI